MAGTRRDWAKAGLGAALGASGQAAAQPAFALPPPGTATAATLRAQAAQRLALPADDPEDWADARRGLIAALPDPVLVRDAAGRPIWDLGGYAALAEPEPPPTVHPGLWRNARLNGIHGLFEVAPGLWQLRGYDLAVMTVIRGGTGYVVIDPLTSADMTRHLWQSLVVPTLGDRPIRAIVYTHSHVDHYAGVTGLVTAAEVAGGAVQILAPEGFSAEVVGETMVVGNAMTRRATAMYGTLLPKGPTGQIDAGIGKGIAGGAHGLLAPTVTAREDGQRIILDGIELICLMAPETEAPAEFMAWLPRHGALCVAELAIHTQHNLYTPRGTRYRDGLAWSKALQRAIDLCGADLEIVFASHQWPRWGRQRCLEHLGQTRDLYRFIHDQTVRLANQGLGPLEIAARLALPDSLAGRWAAHGFYGTLPQNARSQYERHLGYFDGNPANLHRLPPGDAAPRYVAAMGGAEAVLVRAQEAFAAGEYRWAAELADHLVTAAPDHTAGRALLAATYEQLGFQAEAAPWRNIYLTGAQELRRGVAKPYARLPPNLDVLRTMSAEAIIDHCATRLDPAKAGTTRLRLNLALTDSGEALVLGLENAALHVAHGQPDRLAPTLTTTRAGLVRLLLGGQPLDRLLAEGIAQATGDAAAIAALPGLLAAPDFWFDLVPGRRT